MNEQLEDYALNTRVQKEGVIQKVGIVGCGAIGQEICLLASKSGLDVIFLDTTEEKVNDIFTQLELQLDNEINRWGLTAGDKKAIMSRINGTTTYADLHDCNLVHESVNVRGLTSNLSLCRDVFSRLERVLDKDAIIASNNSSLTISEIAINTQYPERTIGMHFISPVNSVKVVEVANGLETNQKTIDTVRRYASKLGKEVIGITETPGHISTRLIVTLINEACELLMEGVGSVESIDKLMKQGYGLQFGPFEMADRLGLDKVAKWMENLYMEYSLQKFKASPIIKRLVRQQYLGRRSNRGFYRYENGQIAGALVQNSEFVYS
jgi:3-hydroxybutyryl-CoA dehydrogenase